MPADLKYTPEHEWLKVEGGDTAVIGITEYAQDALGDLVYVELPALGRKVKKGEDFAVVESVKTAAEVYSPVTGEVVAITPMVAGNTLPNTDPTVFSDQPVVLVRVKLDNPAPAANLINGQVKVQFAP